MGFDKLSDLALNRLLEHNHLNGAISDKEDRAIAINLLTQLHQQGLIRPLAELY